MIKHDFLQKNYYLNLQESLTANFRHDDDDDDEDDDPPPQKPGPGRS